MSHDGKWVIATLCMWALMVMILGGCSATTRRTLTTLLLDGASAKPTPPTRRMRQDLLRDIEDLKRQLAETRQLAEAKCPEAQEAGASAASPPAPLEHMRSWPQAHAALPKDAAGEVNWDEAVALGLIAPRTAIEARAPAPNALDLDVEVSTSGSRTFRAAFSHTGHTAWVGCQSCHPPLFPLVRRPDGVKITMPALRQGRWCGACHGTVAFGVTTGCSRCHHAVPSQAAWQPEPSRPLIETVYRWQEAWLMLPSTDDGPDWIKAETEGRIAPRAGIAPQTPVPDVFDAEVLRTPAMDETMKAVFPHAAHTAALACESCHPTPYEMQAGATPMTMEQINNGALCGTCHGSVAFPVSACSRCHPALESSP